MKLKNIIITFILFVLIIVGCLILFGKKEPNSITTNKTIDNSLETKLKNEQYYIKNNLTRYLEYAKNTDLSPNKIITDVNSNLDKTKYEDTEKTNIKVIFLCKVPFLF